MTCKARYSFKTKYIVHYKGTALFNTDYESCTLEPVDHPNKEYNRLIKIDVIFPYKNGCILSSDAMYIPVDYKGRDFEE